MSTRKAVLGCLAFVAFASALTASWATREEWLRYTAIIAVLSGVITLVQVWWSRTDAAKRREQYREEINSRPRYGEPQ